MATEKITKGSIGSLPLEEFVSQVRGIYEEKDDARSIWDVWLHANHHASAIGEEARKYQPGDKLFVEIADFAMWLFTLLAKITGPFEAPVDSQRIQESTVRIKVHFPEIVWNKYPGMCPVCFWRRYEAGMDMSAAGFDEPCDCLLHSVETRKQRKKRIHTKLLRKYAGQHHDDKPASVDQWQKMFGKIYESNLRHLTLSDIAFHLLEEVGEVSYAMSQMYTYRKDFKSREPSWRQIWLEEEIADVTSWLFTLVDSLKLMPRIARAFQKYLAKKQVLREEKITLSGIIWRRYGSDDLRKLYCPHCNNTTKCECAIQLISKNADFAKLRDYAIDVLA